MGAPTARAGQMDRFFFAKKALYIQMAREKAKNMTKKGKSSGLVIVSSVKINSVTNNGRVK